MLKVILISTFLFLITACSVLRRNKSELYTGKTEQSSSEIITTLTTENLSAGNFYIQKADVEITRDGDKEKFMASWKYELPGKSLISIRTRTGIEIARIFLTKDTLLVNDRINRILYFGKPDYLRKNYGLVPEFLPVVLGDYIKGTVKLEEDINCNEGRASLNTAVKGIKTEYIVNCKSGKIIETDLYNEINKKQVEMRYFDFVRRTEGIIASKILIKYYEMNVEISIKIDKIENPWEGKINFIPGRGYEEKRLD